MDPRRYLSGVSVTALGRGNRLIIRTVRPHAKKLNITRQQLGGALAITAFFSPVLARPVARYAPTTMTVILVLWVVVAVIIGNTEAAAKLAAEDDEDQGDAEVDGVEDDGQDDDIEGEEEQLLDVERPEQLAVYVEQAVAIRHAAGDAGVHLVTLLAGLHRDGQAEGWDTTELGARIRAAGLPITKTINIKGSRLAGVRHDALYKALGHSPRLPAHLVPNLTPTEPSVEAAS